VAGSGSDESGDNNVFANAPLRAAAEIPGRIATGPRVWKQVIRFRDDGPLLVHFLPDRLADKPPVVVEVGTRNIDRVIADVGIEACFPSL